ncbi:uncharacterized protein MEPE_03561 [Melanopsichium pennsylvanicum]|uniref:Uncharacterized protein n=1 Tax=Melanopsichium pennsylvanicum TaxID=63383 RepID=A0AAJ4XN24_9BASI|nr:uncharacterized protein MEPE_03561 [Melanopsichium pennsylvanicum]
MNSGCQQNQVCHPSWLKPAAEALCTLRTETRDANVEHIDDANNKTVQIQKGKAETMSEKHSERGLSCIVIEAILPEKCSGLGLLRFAVTPQAIVLLHASQKKGLDCNCFSPYSKPILLREGLERALKFATPPSLHPSPSSIQIFGILRSLAVSLCLPCIHN